MKAQVNGISVNYEVSSKGPPLVFIHGLGGNIGVWDGQIPDLKDGHQVLCYDLRGHGRSDKTLIPEFSLRLWTEDLVALLKQTQLRKPCLIGHSLGAAIAMRTYLDDPKEFVGLVLVGAAASFDSPSSVRMTKSRIEAIRQGGMEHYVKAWWDKNPPFAPGYQKREPRLFAGYRNNLLSSDPRAYVATCLALSRINLERSLDRIRCPTLIITGESDDRTPVSAAELLNKKISNSLMKIVPDSSHSVMIEQPALVNEAIETFLRSMR